jgi:phospholipase C
MRTGNGGGQRGGTPRGLSRRRFLHGATVTAGLLTLGQGHRVRTAAAQTDGLPEPEASGIEHIVWVMMENRSFDHFLGWLLGADGQQAGVTYPDRMGVMQPTHRLAPDFQGCGHPDSDHSYLGSRIAYHKGAVDGWLQTGANDTYAIGYYTAADLAFLGQAAPAWTVCDSYFASVMGESFPNRLYQHCAQTDRLRNTDTLTTLPTIWDRLADARLEGRYYFSDAPFLGLWGTKYLSITRPFGAFLFDALTDQLPQVAFVEPRFLDNTSGTSGDDHPVADIRNGEAFLALVYTAITRSPAWGRTVLVITYDEGGGFFDHVPPPERPLPAADLAARATDGLLGFRVPCLLIAPSAPEDVSSLVFDHTSVLRLIEWRWQLPPLTVRDETATNLAEALDFNMPRRTAPQFEVPLGPFGAPCGSATAVAAEHWHRLLTLAQDVAHRIKIPLINLGR